MRLGHWGTGLFWLLALLVGTAGAQSTLESADARYAQGGLENFKAAVPLYEEALAAGPPTYELYWKTARAHRDYANQAKRHAVKDWEDICEVEGKRGMELAAQAVALQPEGVEGLYYYGLSVGIYSDGVSILTALSEGLKDKTQSSFEKAYAIDKTYNQGGPILSLARFWSVLPWPMRDRDKSLAYFREFEAGGYLADSDEGRVYFGELLIDLGGKENKGEARKLLTQAAQSPEPYFAEWAKRLLPKTE
jgi:hypothetical protein